MIEWTSHDSGREGPAVLFFGGVHGNETCGRDAIRAWQLRLQQRPALLGRGRVSFVPIANPLAARLGRREGDRNLNRDFVEGRPLLCHEDHLIRALVPLMRAHDVLVDLHSFSSPGPAFVMIGPPDNDGPHEPFARSREELALARALGLPIVQGWLQVYARRLERQGTPVDDRALDFGRGTNECMRSLGGYALTVECGQHEDSLAIECADRVIGSTLSALGLLASESVHAPEQPLVSVARSMAWSARSTHSAPQPLFSLDSVVMCDSPHDRFAREWRNLDAIDAGALIGVRANGSELRAPENGCIAFPDPAAAPAQEWYYWATRVD